MDGEDALLPTQPAQVEWLLCALVGPFPGLCMLIALFFVWRYPITRETQREMALRAKHLRAENRAAHSGKRSPGDPKKSSKGAAVHMEVDGKGGAPASFGAESNRENGSGPTVRDDAPSSHADASNETKAGSAHDEAAPAGVQLVVD